MGTRAQINLIDNDNNLLKFYRHSDGYPECVVPSLNILIDWIKSGKCRNDLMQCSGWLVIIGHNEYVKEELTPTEPTLKGYCGWKVGAYEPTPFDHEDRAFLYELNVETLELKVNGKKYKATKKQKEEV